MEFHFWTRGENAEDLADIFLNQIHQDSQAIVFSEIGKSVRIKVTTPGDYTGHMNKFEENFHLARKRHYHKNGFSDEMFPVVRTNLPEGKAIFYQGSEETKKFLGLNGHPRAYRIQEGEEFEQEVLKIYESQRKDNKSLLIYRLG